MLWASGASSAQLFAYLCLVGNGRMVVIVVVVVVVIVAIIIPPSFIPY